MRVIENWSPTVPGTDILRIELLMKMQEFARQPAGTARVVRALAGPGIVELCKTGVLSAQQIARVVGCSPLTVKNLARDLGIELPTYRGDLHSDFLPLMTRVCQSLAAGHPPDKKQLKTLTAGVSATLLERLVGVPRQTVYNVKHRG